MIRTSWFPFSADSDFSIHNIPFGIVRKENGSVCAASAIGDSVIDLAALTDAGFLAGSISDSSVFKKDVLNDFISLGKKVTGEVRLKIQELLSDENSPLAKQTEVHGDIFIPMNRVQMLLPLNIPDYTDFYSSMEHASNVGKMFRPGGDALLPNWKHLPVGYHGRASSIFVSGTDFHRPMGQTMPDGAESPVFGPSKQMDFELEMAFVIGKETKPGKRINIQEADEYIFGMMIFNDWSARDIQKWEYVPLGPFLGKNFASSISPWIVTLEALEPFRTQGPVQDPQVLPYLQQSKSSNFDIQLEVLIQPENNQAVTVSRSNHKYLYWSIEQQLAHHTVNGCNVRVGDVYASGTISAPEETGFGSMLELAWKGTKPLPMPDGSNRKFLNDFDTVIIRAHSEKNGVRVGFGEVTGKILPSIE